MPRRCKKNKIFFENMTDPLFGPIEFTDLEFNILRISYTLVYVFVNDSAMNIYRKARYNLIEE